MNLYFDFKYWSWKRIGIPILSLLGWKNCALNAPFPYENESYVFINIWHVLKGKYLGHSDNCPHANRLETGVIQLTDGCVFQVMDITIYKPTRKLKRKLKIQQTEFRKKQKSWAHERKVTSESSI